MTDLMGDDLPVPEIDTSRPHPARMYDYYIGGKNHFAADRALADKALAAWPAGRIGLRENRKFLGRVVKYLAAEAGIRQFLDIGSGLPTTSNVHEIAQTVDPSCRVVYVDNDPVVLVHARARMRSDAECTTGYVNADARDIAAVLDGAAQTLDLAQPVGVLLIDVLTFVPDAAGVVAGLVAAVAAGSYLTVMQPAEDERLTVAQRLWNRVAEPVVHLRRPHEVGAWLGGLELVEPGLVEVNQWRPSPDDPKSPDGLPLLAAVARKP